MVQCLAFVVMSPGHEPSAQLQGNENLAAEGKAAMKAALITMLPAHYARLREGTRAENAKNTQDFAGAITKPPRLFK